MAKMLAEQTGGQIYTDLCYSPVQAFCGSLLAFGGQSHIHIEDDAILCRDFNVLARQAIDQFPKDVISFFGTQDYMDIERIQIRRPAPYLPLVCTYFPSWFITALVDWIYELDFKKTGRIERDWEIDNYPAEFMRQRDIKFVAWYPALAQHRVGKSHIGKGRLLDRRTKHFIDEIAN